MPTWKTNQKPEECLDGIDLFSRSEEYPSISVWKEEIPEEGFDDGWLDLVLIEEFIEENIRKKVAEYFKLDVSEIEILFPL